MSLDAARLYLVPAPLDFGIAGETADIRELLPMRSLRVAAGLGHWVCENAKTTRAFLKRVDAVCPLARPLQELAIVELPRPAKGRPTDVGVDLRPLLAPLRAGHDLGLMSEAGLPALADPGARLVEAAHAESINVVVLPGASAVSLAVAASGLDGQSFAFVGYVPSESGARTLRLRELEAVSLQRSQTQVIIETPYRNQALLDALVSALQPRTMLSVSVGVTLAQEMTRSGTVSRWRAEPVTLPADVPAVFSILARR